MNYREKLYAAQMTQLAKNTKQLTPEQRKYAEQQMRALKRRKR